MMMSTLNEKTFFLHQQLIQEFVFVKRLSMVRVWITYIASLSAPSCRVPKWKEKSMLNFSPSDLIIRYTSEWLSVCKFSRRKQVANRLRQFSIISCVFWLLFTSKFISFEGNRRAKKTENFMSDSINYFCVFLLRIEHKLAMKRIFFL